MKQITKYVCDKCGQEYLTSNEAKECENNHICSCKKYKKNKDIVIHKRCIVSNSQEMKMYLDYNNKKLYVELNTIKDNNIIQTHCIETIMNYCPECGNKI